jgi:protein-disulfide isomerase
MRKDVAMTTNGSLLPLALLSLVLASSAATAAADKPADKPEKTKAKPAAEAAKTAVSGGAVALVGDAPISSSAFDAALGNQLLPLLAQEYDLKRRVLDDMIAKNLLEKEALARGTTVDALVQQEIDAKVMPVTEAEARAYFDANNIKGRFPGRSEADLLAQIRSGQQQDRVKQRRAEFIRELQGKTPVRVLLEPPRVAVDLAGAPAKGPKDAPVTILEFSDFQCPYCSRVEATLKQVQDLYGDRIRIAFRDFPLPMHAQAPKAAEAAECANEQGKFWEMHAALFAKQAALQVPDLEQRAVDLGLNAEQFNQCLESGKYEADWKKDMDAGSRYGVTGTPAFFVNGRLISGARPIEEFTRVINDELERAGIEPPAPPVAKMAQPVPPAAAAPVTPPEAPKPEVQ